MSTEAFGPAELAVHALRAVVPQTPRFRVGATELIGRCVTIKMQYIIMVLRYISYVLSSATLSQPPLATARLGHHVVGKVSRRNRDSLCGPRATADEHCAHS